MAASVPEQNVVAVWTLVAAVAMPLVALAIAGFISHVRRRKWTLHALGLVVWGFKETELGNFGGIGPPVVVAGQRFFWNKANL